MLEHREMATLKNVYEYFDGKYSYLELRVARLQMKNL
jgi:hypothetical protein